MIPYAQQLIPKADFKNIKKILSSNYLTQGPVKERFEKKISELCKVKYVTSFNSATSALHIACLALGVGKKDIVWTSTNSFVASANCALYCQAKVDLVDISLKDFNLDLDILENKLKLAKRKKKLPKVIIPVHFGGLPPNLKRLKRLKKTYKFKIIEDASHSIGAKYLNSPVGNCKYSDITVFSFHPVKIITTAEGGAATTNNLRIYKRLQQLGFHGITREKKYLNFKRKPSWYYEHQMLGYNYKLDEIQSALGISQIESLKSWIKKRNEIAQKYKKAFKSLPLSFQKIDKNILSSYHLFVILVKKNRLNITRDYVFKILKRKKIFANLHYIPIHKQPYFKKLGFKNKNFRFAEDYYKKCLSIPMYAGLTKSKQNIVIKEIKKIFGNSNV